MSRTETDEPGPVYSIGSTAPRIDAKAKLQGRELFAADLYPADFLWIGVKRSDYAHAEILSIDGRGALKVPGVVAVLTHRDIKGTNRLGIFEKDQPVLADEKVRHLGDAVALLIAESKEALEKGLLAVRVGYRELPAVFDVQAAIAETAPAIHPQRPAPNLLIEGKLSRGDATEILSACAHRIQLKVCTGWQDHAFLETQTGVAVVEADGTLHMTVSTQTPFRDRFELAEALGLNPAKIRIAAPCLGGGFGGKDGITVQAFLAMAALHVKGRPVKIVYSREESILAGTKRHPVEASYCLGCDENGVLQALSCQLLFDTGAYASLGSEVFTLAFEHAGGPYRIPHATIEGKAVYTNNPVAGAFRGFGVPQAAAAMEQAMDELALRAGIDPLEFRRRNVLRQGDCSATGVLSARTIGLTECLLQVERQDVWQQRESWKKNAPRFKRRGIGLAAVSQALGYGPVVPDYGNAKLALLPEGIFQVYVGVVDMGQGNGSTYAQIAGHILGQPLEEMELIQPDTGRTLPSGSASASRTTYTYGNAMIGAAEQLRDRIRARAALMFSFQLLHKARADEIALLPRKVQHIPTGKSLTLAQVAAMMDDSERIATCSYTCPVNEQKMPGGENLRKHGLPHRVSSYAVQLAAVEIDTLTGQTEVCRFLSCVDAGRVLNPQAYEQQVQGGAAQGMGYALFEEFLVDEGRIRTADFSSYILPTAMDIPDMETIAVQLEEKEGPFGMKGIGEIGIDGVYPALANAIADAVGVRIVQGTISAEKILDSLRISGQEAAP